MIAAGTKDTMIPGDSTRALIDLLELAGADLTVNWAPRGHQFTLDELEMARHWFREHREETP
jgi:predicted esterase